MRLIVNKKWCKVCGICESVCQSNAIRIISGQVEIDPERCISCSVCINQCPDLAINMVDSAENSDEGVSK